MRTVTATHTIYSCTAGIFDRDFNSTIWWSHEEANFKFPEYLYAFYIKLQTTFTYCI